MTVVLEKRWQYFYRVQNSWHGLVLLVKRGFVDREFVSANAYANLTSFRTDVSHWVTIIISTLRLVGKATIATYPINGYLFEI